ncbi:tannase/feruloyl esterase family alpha/beta hydrolase, partial [Acetobacter oeni]
MTLPSAISARHLSLPLLKIAFATSTILASANIAHAQNSAPSQLSVVKPVTECSGLAAATPATVEGAGVTAQSKALTTAKGTFCHVTGIIAPSIGFEIDLPQDRWTQRFVESGCGGLCGMINASIGNASRCAPALNGEFVVAASDLGHKGKMGSPDEGAFAADPQKRIDFAYRANHLTAQYAQALIHTYYGQTPRYSYFSGCSDGGREALMEAQRYPQDFNGISAGAPAMLFQVQNSFYHAWGPTVNRRADGTAILLAGKLPVLHAAVIDHCDMLDGTRDGLLTDPRACHVRPEWVRCPTGAADTTRCLTPEEWSVVARLYEGPTDTAGHHFLPGGVQPGSEMGWDAFVPAEPNGRMMGVSMIRSMTPVVLQNPVPADSDAARYPFTTEQFSRVTALHPLNDATSTDLRAFAGNGGKLIMWHGWSDTSIAPMISVAYYKGVRNQMGAGPTDAFLRLFMLPGTEHCGGGDGFSQIDTLQALMTWVEAGKAP